MSGSLNVGGRDTYASRFELKKFDTSAISILINSIDESFGVSSDALYLTLIKPCSVINNKINIQYFKNACLSGSLESDYFSPPELIKEDMQLNDGVLIKLQTDGAVDNKGFQNLVVRSSDGSATIPVGEWHPSTGKVMVTKNVFSGDTIRLRVRPAGGGSDKFNIKENMYFSNLSFENFSLVARS